MKNSAKCRFKYSLELSFKIEKIKKLKKATSLGGVIFNSPLILAPMSQITSAPFRLLMEDLGSGGSISELTSSNGIFYNSARTKDMLNVDPREECVGIQLFGEKSHNLMTAALLAQEKGAKFIDINMGCPVKKVVSKGSGSALIRKPLELYDFLSPIKKALIIPLSIKIRLGHSEKEITASEVVKVANDIGIEFVTIHGRTTVQLYQGKANWELIENIAKNSFIPIIGNGDLNTKESIADRMKITNCKALMIGRGACKNPFIFLEGLAEINNMTDKFTFSGSDMLEVIDAFSYYSDELVSEEKIKIIQLKKFIVGYTSSFPYASELRNKIFALKKIDEIKSIAKNYFSSLPVLNTK
ncbi:MAG: tRNA-dihydrouridine synthase [Oligoflexia bacterium]|nr:tRNA-dihydrouridine synthase [Oligoflexia bacterium]